MVAPILDHMTALADPTRCRMLMMLEKQELTVSELCAVLQMPQSTVSRHLKTLSDDDWVTSRRDGTSRFYSMPVDDLDSGAKRLWPIIREQVASTTEPVRTIVVFAACSRVAARSRRNSSRPLPVDGITCAVSSSAMSSFSGLCSGSSTRRWSSATSAAERDSSRKQWRHTFAA